MSKSIHLYRPQRSQPDALEAIFVARESITQDILQRLEEWAPGKSRQHYLIIGPRGIGKTYLLTIIKHRISKTNALNRKWLPVTIAEDAYGIAKVSDLLLESIRILGEQTDDEDIQKVHNDIRFDDNDSRVVDLALDGLRRFHRANGRGILLMMENLNRLIERQIRYKAEIHLLRKILIEEEWLSVICTSPTYLNAVTYPEEPLFEFFQVKLLSEFTSDEQQLMLQKKATFEGNTDFKRYLSKFRSRLQALYHFTGGNPRLTVMLYDLVAKQRIVDMTTELDLLLDQLTPFYQDRMKDIPDQEGKLLETMALMPEGCTPTELAREARITPKIVRALLSRLERSGYIRHEMRRRKKTVYIIPERFFRIWHQMNHSRAARGRIQYLLEFFASWYATKEERDHVWSELSAQFQHGVQEGDVEKVEDLTEYMKYVVDVSKGSEKYDREFDRLKHTARLSGPHAIMQELTTLDKQYRNDKDYFIHKGYFLANDLEMHEAAIGAFQAAIKLKRDDIVALFNEAVALDKLRREVEAQRVYEETAAILSRKRGRKGTQEAQQILVKILSEDKDFLMVRIAAYVLGRTADLGVASEVITIFQVSNEPWRRRHCATALGLLKAKEAIDALLEGIGDDFADVRGSAATALGRIGAKQAVDPLIYLLWDSAPLTRASAATALGRIKAKQAVDPLLGRLQDRAASVRGSAATALGRLGAKQAVEPLIRLLRDVDSITCASAATALGRIGAKEAAKPLISLLQDQVSKVRGSAATALGRIGAEEAIDELLDCLKDISSDVRSRVASALGQLRANNAVEPLLGLLKDEDSIVRASAATSLGYIESLEAVEALIYLLVDEASNVRGSAATALGRIGDRQAIKPLLGRLWDTDGLTRASAATALGRIGAEEAIEPLIECLTDRVSEVRGSAATALGLMTSKQAIKPLTALLQDEFDVVRKSAATALIRIASDEPIPDFLSVINLLINLVANRPEQQIVQVAHNLLRASLGTANINIANRSLDTITSRLSLEETVWEPYRIAIKYLKSEREPAILERQHLEMREAVTILIDIFDQGLHSSK